MQVMQVPHYRRSAAMQQAKQPLQRSVLPARSYNGTEAFAQFEQRAEINLASKLLGRLACVERVWSVAAIAGSAVTATAPVVDAGALGDGLAPRSRSMVCRLG